MKQRGSLNMPTFYNGHLRGPVTLKPYCRAFGRGAVSTCFYDFGLSRLGFEHPTFRLGGERSYRLHERRDYTIRGLRSAKNDFFRNPFDFHITPPSVNITNNICINKNYSDKTFCIIYAISIKLFTYHKKYRVN